MCHMWRAHSLQTTIIAVQHAKDTDCRRVVWQVLDWNEAAIGFYKSLGAELATEWLTCRLHHQQILDWQPRQHSSQIQEVDASAKPS